jgi:ankyrin repeat protein
MLQNCLPQNVQHVLRELPKSLNETYERMLKGIGTANRRQAHRLLQCLTVATRPLRVEELAEILALDFDKDGVPALNTDWRWDDQQQCVLSTCSSLVVIVDGIDDNFSSCRLVQFAHFSVKEFLTSDRLADLNADIFHFHISLEPAHTIMAQACLGILLQSDNNGDDNHEVKDNSPLARYAAQYWVVHAQFENVSLRVQVGMRQLFDPAKPYFVAWRELHNIDNKWTSFLESDYISVPLHTYGPDRLFIYPRDYALLWHDAPARRAAPLCLYYASFCGFSDLTKYLITKGPQHVNARVGLNESPLVAALRNRHIQVAKLLHQHGAVLHIIGYQHRTLLHAASKDGLLDVAQWLLNVGADANAREKDHMTPLHLAAAQGHRELVQTLLRHGADVNAVAKGDRTPMHEASARGHLDIVRLLIQHGADVNRDLQGLLLLAASSTSAETMQFFIQLGADVNAQDGSYSTPLHLASSSKGNAESVRLLIEHGADVHAQDADHSMPLHLASSWGLAETVKQLIEHGASINAQDGSNSTPLHLVSSNREAAYVETARLLIKHGADVNAQDWSRSTPLHLASSSLMNAESARILIEHRADVNAQDANLSTPLHLSSSSPLNAETVQLLIEHGADLDAQDQCHSTPLHLASSMRSAEIVRLLTQHGANVNARDQNHSTPLHLASSVGSAESVRLLIEYGADIYARDQSHKTPLDLVSSTQSLHQYVETMRVFTDYSWVP